MPSRRNPHPVSRVASEADIEEIRHAESSSCCFVRGPARRPWPRARRRGRRGRRGRGGGGGGRGGRGRGGGGGPAAAARSAQRWAPASAASSAARRAVPIV